MYQKIPDREIVNPMFIIITETHAIYLFFSEFLKRPKAKNGYLIIFLKKNFVMIFMNIERGKTSLIKRINKILIKLSLKLLSPLTSSTESISS